jgi:hypothetical protein
VTQEEEAEMQADVLPFTKTMCHMLSLVTNLL